MQPDVTVLELRNVLVRLLIDSVDRIKVGSDEHAERIVWRLFSKGWVHFPNTDATYRGAVLTQSGADLAIKLQHRSTTQLWKALDNLGSTYCARLPFDVVCDAVCRTVDGIVLTEMMGLLKQPEPSTN